MSPLSLPVAMVRGKQTIQKTGVAGRRGGEERERESKKERERRNKKEESVGRRREGRITIMLIQNVTPIPQSAQVDLEVHMFITYYRLHLHRSIEGQMSKLSFINLLVPLPSFALKPHLNPCLGSHAHDRR
jgi:hypothetical protein